MAKSSSSTKRTGSSGGSRGSTSATTKDKTNTSATTKNKTKEDALDRWYRHIKEVEAQIAADNKAGKSVFERNTARIQIAGGIFATKVGNYMDAVKAAKGKPHERKLRSLINFDLRNAAKREKRLATLRSRSHDRSLSAKERSKARRSEIRLDRAMRNTSDTLRYYMDL